ncbi:MAG: FkbM family methyltransferase [Chitinophagales bacterium]|nr:FkbM family methyltransferase [Bacteroidota bacterium]
MKEFIFSLLNRLYYAAYPLYKPLYFWYKKISDKDKIQLLQNHLKPSMKVLDIGANIGFYTQVLAECVGENGEVWAFEPDETNFRHLQENTQQFPQVSAVQKAVGEKNKLLKLYFSDKLNVDHQTFDSGEGRNFKEIDCVSLDAYLPEDVCVDVIKMDIQGYEYFALQGMQQLIERSSPLLLIGEFWPYALHKAGIDAASYLQLLKSLGFEVTVEGFPHYTEVDFSAYKHQKSFYTDIIARK